MGNKMNKYKIIKRLGEGTFGEVFLAKKKTDVVIKRLKEPFDSENGSYLEEAEVLRKLHHPCVVTYIESFFHKKQLCIVMAYCEGGTLATAIKKWERSKHLQVDTLWWSIFMSMFYFNKYTKIIQRTFTQQENSAGQTNENRDIASRRDLMPKALKLKVVIFRQLCQAVDYIHRQRIMHRDIKPENILMTKNGDIKLGDFGLSKIMQRNASYTQTVAGTPYYMAPEILSRKRYNNKCDIWSLGCVLYEMLTFKPAFTGSGEDILGARYTELPLNVGPDFTSLVQILLVVDPSERPSAQQILDEPFMRTVSRSDFVCTPPM